MFPVEREIPLGALVRLCRSSDRSGVRRMVAELDVRSIVSVSDKDVISVHGLMHGLLEGQAQAVTGVAAAATAGNGGGGESKSRAGTDTSKEQEQEHATQATPLIDRIGFATEMNIKVEKTGMIMLDKLLTNIASKLQGSAEGSAGSARQSNAGNAAARSFLLRVLPLVGRMLRLSKLQIQLGSFSDVLFGECVSFFFPKLFVLVIQKFYGQSYIYYFLLHGLLFYLFFQNFLIHGIFLK